MGASEVQHQVRLVFFFRRKDLQKVSSRMAALGVQENWAVGADWREKGVPAAILGGPRTWTRAGGPQGRRMETAVLGRGMEKEKRGWCEAWEAGGPLESH